MEVPSEVLLNEKKTIFKDVMLCIIYGAEGVSK
jgi:hypothetical protein